MPRLIIESEPEHEPCANFGLRDMLMPADRLERTDWEYNPLVEYSQRSARRPWRFILTRVLELILIVFFFFFVLNSVRVLREWEYQSAIIVPPVSFISYSGPDKGTTIFVPPTLTTSK